LKEFLFTILTNKLNLKVSSEAKWGIFTKQYFLTTDGVFSQKVWAIKVKNRYS
jgi:hypothetical protein